MNTTAVLIGVFYGVISAVACYIVSMITSGLFARPFYRLYARVLVGICCVMLLAPGLRWLGGVNPELAAIALTLAQYAVMVVLGYGVFRFNRDYMKKVFLDRKTHAYFTFGTLANAAVVTLAFLHFSITGAPAWRQHGEGYIGIAHYGPLLVMLAAMIFHTDFHLKESVGDLRRFSRFTFVGYAVSFLGLAFSIVPYLGISMAELGVTASASPLLENFFSAQALLIAIIVYAWMVWRYESIPPLFLLLLAVIAEYHVLIAQWAIKAFGPASWGLAALPLFTALVFLDDYFTKWDERKRKRLDEADPRQQADLAVRFAMPFRLVLTGLGIALFCITLSTRLGPPSGSFYTWLTATFAIYACFFVAMAVFRKEPAVVYVSGSLAGLAALLGPALPGGPLSMALLGVLAALWGAAAIFGDRINLKRQWRTPLCDCSLLSASLVTVMVFLQHFLGPHPYFFDAVGLLHAVGLAFAAIAFLICAYQYRSKLPVFAALFAVATSVPPWCAAIGLAATSVAALIQRRRKEESAIALEDRLTLFGTIGLPGGSVLPELYEQPLTIGAIPLALIGLLISASHVLQGNLTATVLIGAAMSAIVLLWLTGSYRVAWLYVTALAASYFAVHSIAHGLSFHDWPDAKALSAHLLVAATISLAGWTVATAYAKWCEALLKRVAEKKEPGIRARRAFYAGWLYQVTCAAACAVLVVIGLMWFRNAGTPIVLCVAAAMIAPLFAHAASLYGSQVGSYLSLSAFTLALLNALTAVDVPRPEMSLVFGVVGMTAAAIACFAWPRQYSHLPAQQDAFITSTLRLPSLDATGIALWLGPLAVYSLVCSFAAAVVGLIIDGDAETVLGITWPACATLALAAASYLLSTRAFRNPAIYIAGIGFAYSAVHASVFLLLGYERLDLQARLVHLAVMAGLALASCCLSAVNAYVINVRLSRADKDAQTSLRDNREFFAGILMDVAFVASVLTLFGVAKEIAFEEVITPASAGIIGFISFVLTVAFSFSGLIYRSRIQTYCALAAACLGLHTAAVMFVPEALRIAYQTLSISTAAVLFGVIAWLICRYQRGKDSESGLRRWQNLQCRQDRPLPLVSMDATLWARPLAHVSIVLAYLTVCLVGRDWVLGQEPRGQSWLTVTPIYLASFALFVATTTHQFGWLRSSLLFARAGEQTRRLQSADDAEKGIHYVMSLITSGLAIHLTVHLFALQALTYRFVLSCHLLLGALLALVGWSLATLGIYRYSKRLRTTSDRRVRLRDLALYGGVLQRVSVIAAVVVFVIASGFGIPPRYLSIPLLGSIALVSLLFGLISVTYRSQLAGYLALLASGLLTLHLAAIAAWAWGTVYPLDAPAIAILGLVLVSLAALAAGWNRARPAAQRLALTQSSSWLRPRPCNVDALLTTWTEPLREASLFYAVVSLAVMLAHRWFLHELWAEANVQALITYACVAVSFAIAARIYDFAPLTYAAAIVVTLSAVPQLLISGLPITHLGIALALIAILFWMVGFIIERHCVRLSRHGRKPLAASLIRVYERPMIRCSAVLAVIAIAHGLLVWKIEGWLVSQTPIVVACALGAVTLLLNARSLNLLDQVTRARLLVYLGCASVTGCALAITSIAGSFHELGPVAAITALIFALIGLLLLETSPAGDEAKPAEDDFRRTYGDPISNFAAGLSVLAVAVALIDVIGSVEMSWELLNNPAAIAERDVPPLLPAAITLLVSAATCMLSVRLQKQIGWLYAAVILGTAGLCLLLESQTDWTRGEMVVATLLLMNLLVVLARIIRANRRSVESTLGLSASNCERPFYQWPLVVATSLLAAHSILVASVLTDLAASGLQSTALQWPWLWVTLLAGGLYLHALWLQTRSVFVHLLVWTTVAGVIGACISSDTAITSDDAVVAVGLGWGALALGLLVVDHITRRRGEKEAATPLFSGIGDSIITIVYLLISGLAIAPVALSTPAPSVALSMVAVSILWLWMAWVSGEEVLGYAAVIGFFSACLFAGHTMLGIPLVRNPLGAFFVIGYSFLLYGVNILISRSPESRASVLIRPTYYLALLLPISLSLTIPFDQRAPAAFALLAAAAFYLVVAQQSQYRWALYVAAGLANIAIYLWVPTARELTGLNQLYVIPAAITVLIFAQLHRHELNHQVLTSIRLVASGAILAVSTFEVFFAEESGLLQFVAILFLSLAGITAGIALRIKAFIYVGLAFLVINVVGQLGLQFHYESGIIKAIILIGVGLLILAAMIFFNIHRERILRQYRGFLADKSWE